MKILFNNKFLEHNTGSQEEGEYRIRDFSRFHRDINADDGLQYIALIHPPEYIEHIKLACLQNQKIAEIQLSPKTWEAAQLAAALTVKAADEKAFAVVRPPGHHAGRASSMGFCLFNNMAIAAQKLVNEGKKVFILDIDAHHGNGTQDIFYASDEVFYASIHQSFSWPNTGSPFETGLGPGVGYTLNLQLMLGCGDKAFLEALDKIIEAAQTFKPDVVGVSAGFDAYYKDKMMNLDVSLRAFYECGFRLGRSFDHIFAVLEGGYHEDIFHCVRDFADGIEVGSRPVKDRFNHDMSIG
jgi:acetoin utilization deacetylase AcuC-like enzyme